MSNNLFQTSLRTSNHSSWWTGSRSGKGPHSNVMFPCRADEITWNIVLSGDVLCKLLAWTPL